MKDVYARMILKECLRIHKNQPLLITADIENQDFVNILVNEAKKMDVNDIYLDLIDMNIKHDLLINKSLEELKKHPYFDRTIYNEYAKKHAAFLMLASVTPGLMKDVDQEKLSKITIYSYEVRDVFNDMRNKLELSWCIVGVPTKSWANKVYPNDENAIDKLWDTFMDICGVNKTDPERVLEDKLDQLVRRCDKLNELHIKELHYTNSLGTDFTIQLHENALWQTGRELLKNGDQVLVNFPTEEIFTSPLNNTCNGIVYSSKPLIYNDISIKDFYLEFKDGIVINYGAKEGLSTLKELINSCPNANRLGEVALVENDSAISNTNTIFYETLYDENASCHMALGESFSECLINGTNMNKDELESNHYNQCHNHVDFMIGTSDLSIKALTYDNQEIDIFINGNFTDYFK